MTREKLLAKLQLCVDDPMWADHVEMPKQLLRVVIEQLGAPAQGAPDIDEARDILQCLFPLHRMVLDQHANVHDNVNVGWTIDLGTLRRASKFILSTSAVTSTDYVLIPREPTPEMLRAGFLADEGCEMPGQIYRAMIDASTLTSTECGDGKMIDIVDRLRFDATRCEAQFSKGVAGNITDAVDEIERLREALENCVETLALVEHPRSVDPDYGEEVRRLGDRIGYGALMSSASASWRQYLAARGYPLGGEFVAGPCYATVVDALKKARAALPSTDSSGAK